MRLNLFSNSFSNLCDFSVPRTPSEVFMEFWTEEEVTCSRRHKPQEPPCLSSRLTCPSTSHSDSQLTWDPTQEDRPSHSACSTIGRSSPETHSRREPSLTRLCKQQRRGKVSSPVTQTLEIILTNCNRYCFTPYCMFYFCLDYNYFQEVRVFFILFTAGHSIWSIKDLFIRHYNNIIFYNAII